MLSWLSWPCTGADYEVSLMHLAVWGRVMSRVFLSLTSLLPQSARINSPLLPHLFPSVSTCRVNKSHLTFLFLSIKKKSSSKTLLLQLQTQHLSWNILFYSGTKCNCSDIHVYCPKTNSTKVLGIRSANSLPWDITTCI